MDRQQVKAGKRGMPRQNVVLAASLMVLGAVCFRMLRSGSPIEAAPATAARRPATARSDVRPMASSARRSPRPATEWSACPTNSWRCGWPDSHARKSCALIVCRRAGCAIAASQAAMLDARSMPAVWAPGAGHSA